MAKKKTTIETAAEALTDIAASVVTGEDKKTTGKKGKKDTAEIVAEKVAETVAAIAGADTKPEKKPAAKKKTASAPAKKAAEKKPAAKKTAAKKEAAKDTETLVFQVKGKNYTQADIIALCKSAYKGGTRKVVKTLDVYVKGSKAYYVVNGKDKDEDGKAYFVEL